MNRVRIVCRPPSSSSPNGPIPDLADCDAKLIRDDGTEEPIPGVIAIHWSVRGNEATTAVLEVLGAEIDVAQVDATIEARRFPLETEPEHRYRNDITFRTVVDSLHHLVIDARLTPSEIRAAAMLACIHHEMRTQSPILARFPKDWT